MGKICEKNLLKEIEEGILNVKYDQVAEKLKDFSYEEINNIIYFNIADKTESLTVYGFTQYMYKKTSDTIWLYLSASIMVYVLCRIEGAYAVGFFHARELVKIEKNNIENLLLLLSFYGLPENLMNTDEAENIAKEILKLNMNNERALDVLNEIKLKKI